MSTIAEIRLHIRNNLSDAGITFYSDKEINDSIQDAYNEVVAKTLCNVKSSLAISWPSNLSNYFDFKTDFAVTDYLGTYAIFNNNTKWWLRDDLSLRDFDRIRRDWEMWRAQPQFWTPHSLKYIAIAPILTAPTGNFDLWYYAIAPTITGDSYVPIIAPDQHTLLEYYATADMLETAEEITKAKGWWDKYEPDKEVYKQRVRDLAASQVLLRI